MAGRLKRITFVRRSPSIEPPAFASAWREAVARLLREAPTRPERLALCGVRPGAPYDGVAIEWSDVAGNWISPPGIVDVDSSLTVTVEERAVDGADWLAERWATRGAEPALLLIGCIEARPGLSRSDFRDYWWDQHRPLANRLVPTELAPAAYVHNYVRPGEPGPWAGIGELYERSLSRARDRGKWFESPDAEPLVADEDRFLVRSTRTVLVADQHLLVPA